MGFKNLKQLVETAISVHESDPDTEKTYCSKDESLFFVYHGMMYIIPWSRTALGILEKKGFKRAKLQHLPYEIEVIPKYKKDYWNKLVKEAQAEQPA
jgi:hypothetical protein